MSAIILAVTYQRNGGGSRSQIVPGLIGDAILAAVIGGRAAAFPVKWRLMACRIATCEARSAGSFRVTSILLEVVEEMTMSGEKFYPQNMLQPKTRLGLQEIFATLDIDRAGDPATPSSSLP